MATLLYLFLDLVRRLQATNSRIEKENILKDPYLVGDDIKKVLQFIFNPYITTGISTKKLNKFRNNLDWYDNFEPAEEFLYLDDLQFIYKYVNCTGNDYMVKHLVWYALGQNPEERDLLYNVITKDVKLGVQPTTLNKVFGKGFIPSFDVMLAQKYFDNPDKLLPDDTNYILTTKLDGVRCIAMVEENNIKFYSRQGQIFEGLTQLEEEAKRLPSGYVYDGELLLNMEGLDSKDLYRETMKVVGSDKEKLNITFNVFDMLPVDDFQNGYCAINCTKRKEHLTHVIEQEEFKYIKNVAILYSGNDKSQITYWLDKITSEGGEGVMINIADAPYECKRSKYLLKVKKFQTADVRVIGIEEGTGKNKNKVGALKIEFIGPDGNIYPNDVGSGLTDEEREYYWINPEDIIGKIIEISYFEISTNQNGSYGLRFPTFKWARSDKTEISMY